MNEPKNDSPPPLWLRARWLILAGATSGITLGVAFAQLLPYRAWPLVAILAGIAAGTFVVLAVERNAVAGGEPED